MKTLYSNILYNSKSLNNVNCTFVFVQMYQFSLDLNSLQYKFSLTFNYFETNRVVVKRVNCTLKDQLREAGEVREG